MLDSEADFQARAKDVGLSQTEVDNLKRIGYATFAKLAFSSSYVPGQADEGPLKMLAQKWQESTPARQFGSPWFEGLSSKVTR